MRNPLMAIDAGLSVGKFLRVFPRGTPILKLGIHLVRLVTTAAFARIRITHGLPDRLGHRQAMRLEFFPRTDAACQMTRHLFERRFGFAHKFGNERLRYMAVLALSTHSRAVTVVNRLLVLFENIGFHFMAGQAEPLLAADFHRSHAAEREQGTQTEECESPEWNAEQPA